MVANDEHISAFAGNFATFAYDASAYASADETVEAATSADANFLLQGGGAEDLMARSLWPNGAPPWFTERLAALHDRLMSRNEDWDVWLDWLDARIRGEPLDPEIQRLRVTAPTEEEWKDPALANAAIKRALRDYKPLDEEAAPESDPLLAHATPPPLRAAPQFAQSDAGPVELARVPADAPFAPLQAELIDKIDELIARIDPQWPGYNLLARLRPLAERYRSALDGGEENLDAIWSAGNRLRRALGADTRLRLADDPDDPPIPADAGEMLADAVETHNVLMTRHPVGRALDSARLGPRDRSEMDRAIDAAGPVVRALEAAPEQIAPEAVAVIKDMVDDGADAVGHEGLAAEQAEVVGADAVHNALAALIDKASKELQRIATATEKPAGEPDKTMMKRSKERLVDLGFDIATVGISGGAVAWFATYGHLVTSFASTAQVYAPLAVAVAFIIAALKRRR